ncbi:MAG: NAD(P)/FAD-dependent oxidoreductase [Gammaproteobacteria bacterium]
MNHPDVLIIGGGAAGLMCAIAAGKRGRSVTVIEGANKIGKKILMSGGGRCNFTNTGCKPKHFLSHNPGFCISALARYSPQDFVELVEQHDIPYHAKTPGQLFCDRSSKDIVAMLRAECDAAGVTIVMNTAVNEVAHVDASYTLRTSQGDFSAPSLVIATGGLSIPKMGASDFGYRIARQFELNVHPTRAGLVPFTFSGSLHDLTARLAGVSVDADVACGDTAFHDGLLFTHRGLSGPAALQISSYWQPGDDIDVNLMPGTASAEHLLEAKVEQPKSRLRRNLAAHLPRALIDELQSSLWPQQAERPMAEIADRTLRQIGDTINRWRLKPAATEGYRTAEVTLGGVDTKELSSKTMECNRQPGLFFIGEVVDVTGHLGGYNFQWAWASGQAAGGAV